MYEKKASFLLLMLLCFLGASAQTRLLKGRVTAAGVALPGATVSEKGSSVATSTDDSGNFSISAATGTTLLISYVGYATKELVVGNESVLNVEMTSSGELGEVVVTALGIQRQSKTLTYAAQKVNGSDLTQARDATGSVVNTLSGKVAGLQISQSASGPGGANRVILRGNRSITGNNNALFVVDGVAIDNTTFSDQNTSFGGRGPVDGTSGINPDDVESITVLKGAAAAALYGSRAANGVIIVTTKKGRAGKTTVTVNSGIALATPMLIPSLQNVYGQGSGGNYNRLTELNWGPKMEGQMLTSWTGQSTPFTAQPDNVRDFFEDAITLNNAVGVSSGSEKVQTYLSYAHNDINGLVPANRLQRHTLNLRINAKITDKLSAEGKVTYLTQDLANEVSVGETLAPPISSLYQVPRNISSADMQDYDSFDLSGKRVQRFWVPNSPVLQNPYFSAYRSQLRSNRRDRITALGTVSYDFAPWLKAQMRISLDRYTDKFDEKTYQGVYWTPSSGGSTANGLYAMGSYYVNERNIDFLLGGAVNISSTFSLTYNAGVQNLKRNGDQVNNRATALLKPEQFIITNAQAWANAYNYYERELQGVYATAQLGFKNAVFLDLTARNDWSSTLPSSNRSYFYPSVGLSAVISDLVQMPAWLSFAKARASYTQVGNDPPPYTTLQTYNSPTAGGLNGWMTPGSNKALNDLKPELTKSFEAGIDVRFFKNRLGIDATYYTTNTINQFIQISVPLASGFTTQSVNAGNIRNSGIEVALSGVPVQTKSFSWTINLNVAANRNKVIELSPNLKSYVLGADRLASSQVNEGSSIGELYVQGWDRDAKTGQFLIDANGLPITSSGATKNIGNYNPDWLLGLNNSFNYRNWSLAFLVDGKLGGVVVTGTDALLAFNGAADYTLTNRDGGWILPGVTPTGNVNTVALTAEKFWNTVGGKTPKGEFFAYDATNFRLRELNLGYTFRFSKSIAAVVKSARLAVVGRNLFFLYRGYAKLDIPGVGKRKLPIDPDASGFGTSNFQGLEYMSLPSPRTIGLNLSLAF